MSELRVLEAELVVDAVLGYSLRGVPAGTVADMIRWISGQAAPVLSLDVPSGIDSTTEDVNLYESVSLAGP